MLKPIISAAIFSLMALPALADSLTVTVTNITERGEMHLAIYDDADVFENDNGEKGGAAKGIIQGPKNNMGSAIMRQALWAPQRLRPPPLRSTAPQHRRLICNQITQK